MTLSVHLMVIFLGRYFCSLDEPLGEIQTPIIWDAWDVVRRLIGSMHDVKLNVGPGGLLDICHFLYAYQIDSRRHHLFFMVII